MKWRRVRDGQTENAWAPDTMGDGTPITAADRGRALFVLAQAVAVRRHPYEADPNSGAGNCWCGDHQSASIHDVDRAG